MPFSDGCDILVYGTMGDIGAQVAGSLRSHNLQVVQEDFPQNKFRDEWGYRRKLFKCIDSFNPRYIFPIGNLTAASRVKPLLPQGIMMPVADERTIATLDNKTSCSKLAADCDVPQPRMFASPRDAEGYQVIFKRDQSFGGSGVHRPRNMQALENLVRREEGRPCLIEEFIEGTDWSVDALRWTRGSGIYFRAGCYRSLANHWMGPSTERVAADFPLLEQYARAILDKIDYQGVCGMDFRVDTQGNAWFLECNPRFTGGVGIQIESGFDIPYLLYQAVNAEDAA